MQKVKVTDVKTLEQEIGRLKRRTRELEGELGERVDFFKGNYKKMAVNAVIPGSSRYSGTLKMAGRFARIAWESGKFKSFATGALMTALEFIGVRLGINLFNKYQQHKKKRRGKRRPQHTEEETE